MSGAEALVRGRLAAALIMVLALGLRLVNVDRAVTGDEVLLYRLAQRPFTEIYGAVMANEIYSPVGPYLVHLWLSLASGEVWVRLYFVLFGVGLCAVVYSLGREVLGNGGALLALAASALSPLLITTSQYIRSYADGSFWSALSLLMLVRIWRGKGGRGAWLLYAGATLIAFYTFYFMLLVWVAVNVWLAWRLWEERRPWRPWVAMHAPIAVAMMPGLLMAFYQVTHSAYGRRFNWSTTGFQIAGVHVGVLGRNVLAVFGLDPGFGFPGISRWLPVPVLALCLGAVLATCAMLVRIAVRRLRAGMLPGAAPFCIIVALLPLALAQVMGELAGSPPHAKYFIVPHAVFLLVIAGAILALPRRGLVAAACALVVVGYSSRLPAVYQGEYDVRGAERYLATVQAPDAIVLFLSPSPVTVQPGLRWLDVQAVLRYDFGAGRYRLADRPSLDAALAGVRRVIYIRVYSNQEVFGGNHVILDYLAQQAFKLEQTKRFKNIDVMSFVVVSGDAAQPGARRDDEADDPSTARGSLSGG